MLWRRIVNDLLCFQLKVANFKDKYMSKEAGIGNLAKGALNMAKGSPGYVKRTALFGTGIAGANTVMGMPKGSPNFKEEGTETSGE